jgi:hypothetical protein
VKRSVLLRRLVRARWTQAVSLLLVAFALAAALTGLLAVRTSATQAVADATRADHGGHEFALQVLDPSVIPVLAARTDVLPIWQSNGSAATATREVPVTVRSVSSSAAASGGLVRGRQPQRPGELTVSSAAGRALGVTVGDTVTVTTNEVPTPVRIVGTTVTPDDRDDATVVLFAAGDPQDATVWVSDVEVFEDPQLGPILDRRQAKARTVEILAADRRTAATETLLSALRYSGPAFAVLAVCIAGVMLAAMHRERRRDVRALTAAGMPAAAAWRLLSSAAAWCLVVGTAAGMAFTLGGFLQFRETVSAPLGQQWQTVTAPWVAVIAYLVLFAPAALAVAWLTNRGQRLSAVFARLSAPVWTGAALFVPGVTVLIPMAFGAVPETVAPLAGLVTVIGFSLLLTVALTASRRPALRRLISQSARPLTGLALVAAVITFSAGYYTARQDHSARVVVAKNVPFQPPGSLFVDGINAAGRTSLQQQYRALGGRRTAAYLTVAETTESVRATNTRLVDCLTQRGTRDPDDVLADCGPDGTMSPINTIALTDEPTTAGLRADRAMVEDGRIGLLTFAGDSIETTATATEPATADPVLGGNLPGAVVGTDSPLARRLHLTPSGGQSLVLLDFYDLPEAAQARMRSIIDRTASTAQTDEAFDNTAKQFRAVATAASIGTTAVILLVVTTVGMAFLASQRNLRRMLGRLGINRRRRRVVGARMLLIPLGAQIFALGVARFSAGLAGAHDVSGFGRLWMVPGVTGMIACLVVAVAYGRAPGATATE